MAEDLGYLQVCCGPYRILVPTENVSGVDPDFAPKIARSPLRQARRLARPFVIDARVLLGLSSEPDRAGVSVHWRRTDDSVRAVLLVDRVESLRSGVEEDLLPLPRVPRHFHDMFDLLLVERSGQVSMRLRRDVNLRLDDRAGRRRFCRAVLGSALPAEHERAFA